MCTKLGKEFLVLGEKFMYPTAFFNCVTDMNYPMSHVYFIVLLYYPLELLLSRDPKPWKRATIFSYR